MAFDEVRFPVAISWGAIGGPGFHTTVMTQAGGFERRNVDWAAARHRWDVAHGLKTAAQHRALLDFFFAREGRARGFRFFDWQDFAALDQPLGIGDGVTASVQLVKSYSSGGRTHERVLKKIIHDETIGNGLDEPLRLAVRLDGAPLAEPGNWSVDVTTGVLAFTSPPGFGAAITADIYFDVPARFDTDEMLVQLESVDLHSWGQIPVVEIRV